MVSGPEPSEYDKALSHMAWGIQQASAAWTGGHDEQFWLHLAQGAMNGLGSEGGKHPRGDLPRIPRTRPARPRRNTGRVLSDADIQKLADEADGG